MHAGIIWIEVNMKMYYMHARHHCGCFFSSALWEEKLHANGKTSWNCVVDPERVKLAFPEEYDAVCQNFRDLQYVRK